MSAWAGPGGAAKSCDALLTRVEQNDATLQELVILSNKTFGATEVERLAAALATGRNTNLKSLSASGHALAPNSVECLGSAIGKQMSALVDLAIGHQSMGDAGVMALCTGLGDGGGGLESVDLEWKDISTRGMAAIGKTFGPSQTLKKLNLSRNERIKDEGVIAMCNNASSRCRELGLAYYSFPVLQELNLADCGIGGGMGIESLVELLGNFGGNVNSRALSLVLSGNSLGLEACVALASLLCDSPQVSSLSVSNCGIGNAEMSILCAAVGMQSCNGVTLLDLSSNNIGKDGATSLSSSLAKWTSLKDLRLAGNPILQGGVEALMNQLVVSDCALKSLDLSQTSCGAQGAAAAVKCTKLTSLRLFNNKLGSDGFETLVPFLKGGHASLVNLDLGGNDASEEAVVRLLNSIADAADFESKLRVLEIGGNSGGDAVEEAIKRVKQVHPGLDIARDKPKGETVSR